MNKIIPYLFFCLICFSNLKAQTIVYQRTFGNTGNDLSFTLVNTADGGYAMAGHSSSFSVGDFDIVLVKLDSLANLQWSKRYGGAANEEALKLVQCNDGGFAICGMTQSYGAGAFDAILIRTDSIGNELFIKTYGGTGNDRFLNIRQTTDSGFILAGSTTNFGFGDWDMLYIKTDVNGDTLWTKIIGGVGYDQGTDAIETADSGFAFIGRAASWGAGYSDIFLAKANSSGDTLWTSAYGSGGFDEGMKVRQTFDHGFIITGATNGLSTGGYEAYLNKIDSVGNLMWSRVYGGIYTEATYDVLQLADSGYVIAGITESYGSNHSRPAKTISNVFESQVLKPQLKLMGDDNTNVFVVRTDVNGDTLWSYAYGGNLQDEGFGIVPTADKGFAIAAYSMSFNADSGDYYFIKTDSNGFSGCNDEQAYPAMYNPATIVSSTTAQVNSGLVVTTVSPVGLSLPSVVQNTQCYLVLTDVNELVQSADRLFVFPNPSAGYILLNIPLQIKNNDQVQITIYDVIGRIIKQLQVNATENINIDVQDLTPGMYQIILKCEKSETVFIAKVVVK